MASVVLDASAVLARTLHEPGAEQVDALIDGAWISAVNVAEVVQRLVESGMDGARAVAALEALPCKVAAFDRAAAYSVGLLKRGTRRRGLSLGDRACLALGRRLGLPVYTADRAWAELDLGVEVVLIR
jgi:ribonuclease VapC